MSNALSKTSGSSPAAEAFPDVFLLAHVDGCTGLKRCYNTDTPLHRYITREGGDISRLGARQMDGRFACRGSG